MRIEALSMNMTRIILAQTKVHLQSAHELFVQYADSLRFDLEFQGFSQELAGLPGDYASPGGSSCWPRVPETLRVAWLCARCRIKFVK